MCIIIIISFANTPFATIETAVIKITQSVLLCKKGFLKNSAKLPIKHQKRDSNTDVFLQYGQISHSLFKNTVTHEYFFGWTCRLGTRVSSIFKALSQKPISYLVEHLRWSFFCENSQQLQKVCLEKNSIVMFDQVLIWNLESNLFLIWIYKLPLKSAAKWETYVTLANFVHSP